MKLNKVLILILSSAFLLSTTIGCRPKPNQTHSGKSLTQSESISLESPQVPEANSNPLDSDPSPDASPTPSGSDPLQDKYLGARLLLSSHGLSRSTQDALFKKFIEDHHRVQSAGSITVLENPRDLLDSNSQDPYTTNSYANNPYYTDPHSSEPYYIDPYRLGPQGNSYSHSQGGQPNTLNFNRISPRQVDECSNLTINAIYESVLTKNILFNKTLKLQMSQVLTKVIAAMKTSMGDSVFENAFRSWAEYTDPSSEFPVAQKLKVVADLLPRYSNRTAALKAAINSTNNPNPALQLDFIAFNAKSKDQIGIPSQFLDQRDYFFNAIVRRLRGYRGNRPQETNRYQYGIVPFDLPFLEMERTANTYPWRHWGRDSCVNKANSSLYSRGVSEKDIPLTCGISGTTNLFLWSVFAYKADLNRKETLLLLLSIWSTLCADGGHSLQEVLTSSKLIAIYVKDMTLTNAIFRHQISQRTLDSLVEVTHDIQALPESGSNSNESEHLRNTVHDKIYSRSYAVIQLVHNNEIPDPTPILQRELEVYFRTDRGNEKEFGTYWSSFFKKFSQNTAFLKERSRSKKQLKAYAHEYCSDVANETTE